MTEGLLSKSEDLWNPYKELKNVIWRHLNESDVDLPSSELENTLRKHKQTFFSLLQNPPKNAKSREELKKGMVDGIIVKGLGHQILSKELYQEAIILSDMFDINEFIALDLLCTAQIQMPYYPSYPRGLVAILLYYDGRKALVSALLYLVQARSGVQWALNVKPDVERLITEYTDELQQAGLFNRIFELLKSLDYMKEVEKLQQNLALGGPKHRRQVTDLFNDIRQILAEIVFSWSAQTGLNKDTTILLIKHLREVKLEEEASGKIDNVNMYLLLALMSALDLSPLHTREDGEEAIQTLPILAEKGYLEAIIKEFQTRWVSPGLEATATFSLAVCLASLRIVPQNQEFQEVINKEDALVDTGIELNVFTFMHNVLLENETIFKEQFLLKRLHNLISDFLVYMFPKVKELRLNADEISRTMQVYSREGVDPPINLPRYFEYLLLTIGKLYSKNKLDPELNLAYWSPVEISPLGPGKAPNRAVSLFKFIRLAGDLLPTSLFVPYLTMLSGLASTPQSARQCFNMLKQSGVHVSANLSWDHFFMSFTQYYSNLRQEAPPVADTVYRRSVYHKGVSPQELEGLNAVLVLIRVVAEQDEFSRLALCEHPGWSPLTVLLGLVSCSVPIPFKAELVLTLAALSKSSENALQMWENLEASQILVTVPTTSSYTPRGLQTELEEIEARLEEYPLTRAFMKLLDVLSDFGIPRTLGAGSRKPGFDPYLSFTLNSVFLKCNSRTYKDSVERWEVAAACLKLYDKFLNQYTPKVSDFQGGIGGDYNAPPGFHLMLLMNNKSEMFNIVMDIVDEGNRMFDSYQSFQGEAVMQRCTLSCLNILYRVLVLQTRFFSLLASSSSSLILTSASKLLLGINRRSGKPDHCINIAKYISYQALYDHALLAVKVLCHVTSSPVAHNQFMNILLSDEAKKTVKVGFVESLDAPVEQEIVNDIKLEIFKLLKQCLSFAAPNLSHFLLGFDVKRDVSKTEFQFPGVLDFPRSCFHSLISIMEAKPAGTLLESAYHLLYLLSSNNKTSTPVLRFIRLNKTFFQDHLTDCHKVMLKGTVELNQMSWLLKTLAIEIKAACRTNQVTYLKKLSNFLFSVPFEEVHIRDSFASGKAVLNKTITLDGIKFDNFMTHLVKHFECRIKEEEMPQWEFFNATALGATISSCQKKAPPKLIDIKKLHQILYDELRSLQGTAGLGQIQAITQEIPKVLKYALEVNKRSEAVASVVQLVDAWRQVGEVFVIYMPAEVLSYLEQEMVCFSLSSNILKTVNKIDLLPEISRLLSGAVLIFTDHLKMCHAKEMNLAKVNPSSNKVNLIEIYYNLIREMLDNLVKWIMNSDVVDGELRINIYACLVTLLQLSCPSPKEDQANSSMYISRLDGFNSLLEFTAGALDVSNIFNEKLIEIICQDCIGGQEISRILAMSSFSSLLTLSGNINWILYVSGKGYLKHIIQSILDSDQDLKLMLEPNAESIKPLYLYLAKMLLLARLAQNRVGAELLLEQKLFSCFSNMSVFLFHPEVGKNWQPDALQGFLPPVEQQYLQLWLPTLDISNCILTTLGTENQSAVVQIMYFLLSHLDVVELILRSGHPELSHMSLKELSLLTSVIARTANNDLVNIMENPNIAHSNRAQLYRIQKLMLALLPKFILSEDNVRILLVEPIMKDSGFFDSSNRLLYALQIVSNLLCYARNAVSNNGIDHGGVGALFHPSLNDPLLNPKSQNEQKPSIGVLVQQLICCVHYQNKEKVTRDLLKRTLSEVPDMNTSDLKVYLEESVFTDIVSQREKVYEMVSEKYEKKKKELDYTGFIIENCLYLIWAHLDYYMLRAIPKAKPIGFQHNSANLTADNTLASATEAAWKVSAEDISNLKQGLVSLFNDSFSKQLMESSQDRTETDRGFIEALLRKIKRLVQFVPVK